VHVTFSFGISFPDMPKLKLLTFTRYYSNILKEWWEVLYGFWKFTVLSRSERILKIFKELTKLSP